MGSLCIRTKLHKGVKKVWPKNLRLLWCSIYIQVLLNSRGFFQNSDCLLDGEIKLNFGANQEKVLNFLGINTDY